MCEEGAVLMGIPKLWGPSLENYRIELQGIAVAGAPDLDRVDFLRAGCFLIALSADWGSRAYISCTAFGSRIITWAIKFTSSKRLATVSRSSLRSICPGWTAFPYHPHQVQRLLGPAGPS